jgi:AraC family transcriptional regulator of adaptative response/methylated-DNA-[protein]-cysteine methyltransferase
MPQAQAIDPVAQARAAIDAAPDAPPTLRELARECGLSPSRLTRAFRERHGLTPREYAHSLKLAQFKRALREGEEVTAAVYRAGFGSPSRVYENTARHLGMTPGAYRRGGEGVAIRYTVAGTPLGRLLVATTAHGLCAVRLGASADELQAGLRAEFPRATLERVDDGADEWIAATIARVSAMLGLEPAHGAPAPLPADLAATAFQWRVWEELMRIPAGQTRSYTDIARAIGRPRAVRAVARACASNRLALVVPCHRVVREDGSLGGYRWGLATKERLLRMERAAHGA